MDINVNINPLRDTYHNKHQMFNTSLYLYFVHYVVPMGVYHMGNSGRFPQGKPATT